MARKKNAVNMRGMGLKPCPFCGGAATIYHFKEAGLFSPYCRRCKSEFGKDFKTFNGALMAWNRRADDE